MGEDAVAGAVVLPDAPPPVFALEGVTGGVAETGVGESRELVGEEPPPQAKKNEVDTSNAVSKQRLCMILRVAHEG
jgi:hypothetical protein